MYPKGKILRMTIPVLFFFFLSASGCRLDPEEDPICRICTATYPNGSKVEVEACSSNDEMEFMTEYRDFNPRCL